MTRTADDIIFSLCDAILGKSLRPDDNCQVIESADDIRLLLRVVYQAGVIEGEEVARSEATP